MSTMTTLSDPESAVSTVIDERQSKHLSQFSTLELSTNSGGVFTPIDTVYFHSN